MDYSLHGHGRSHGRSARKLLIGAALFLISLGTAFAAVGDSPSGSNPQVKDVYSYDVSAEGTVRVTVHPISAEPLFIPVTAEKITAKDLEYTSVKNWEKFRYELMVKPTGPNPTLTYEWPDGALPWAVKTSEWLVDSKNKWFTDNFWTAGPAAVSITVPAGAEILEYRERECPMVTDATSDGRARVTFDIPAGKRVSWLGVVYKWPWADKYSIYGGSPVPLYYPTMLGRYPEYMAQLKHFYDANLKFYKTYQTDLRFTPIVDIGLYTISWIQGYGGAYTSGHIGTYYNYRGIAGFEYPIYKEGSNMMGAYHEMAHAFQPAGYPDFIGGHTWTAYLTREYDWNDFPTVDKVADRKRQGGYPEQESLKAHDLFREMHAKGLLPGLWYKWPETASPEVEAFFKERNVPYSMGALHEKAEAGAMMRMDREFGQSFWGRYARTFLSSGLAYTAEEPVLQKVVAAQMGVAEGRDLTAYFTDLTGCDLAPQLTGVGKEILANGGMEGNGSWTLESTQPGAVMDWDKKVRHEGKQSLKIKCDAQNVAMAAQKVSVQPKTYYLFTAWVRTSGVDQTTSGANLCVVPDPGSMQIRGTNDWKRISMLAYSGENTEMTIGMRLGWTDQPAVGTVWFDDAEMIPLFTKLGWQRLLTLGSPAEVSTKK